MSAARSDTVCAQAQRARCGLADLLFAYCYDARTTEGGASRWKLRAVPPG